MNNRRTKRIPAYTGEEPYLFFCFSDADVKRVLPLLERMAARGTRVWYSVGKPRDLDERRRREARMSGASLVVAYLSAAAREDLDFKSAGLYCEHLGKRIVCIDADEDLDVLSFGFGIRAKHLSRRAFPRAAALEEELVRCEGFSQELIGEEPVILPPPIVRIAAALAVVSALALALVLFGGRAFGWMPAAAEKNDTVRIEDASLRAAVRASLGGGAITEENVGLVETIRLKELPADGGELEKLPALARVEIPQELAPDALWLLDEGYTVVLCGGGAK